jgi:hypothetical protein
VQFYFIHGNISPSPVESTPVSEKRTPAPSETNVPVSAALTPNKKYKISNYYALLNKVQMEELGLKKKR